MVFQLMLRNILYLYQLILNCTLQQIEDIFLFFGVGGGLELITVELDFVSFLLDPAVEFFDEKELYHYDCPC